METVEYRDHAVTYAAIDIGSNAVRLLIKQLEDDFQPRFNKVLLLRVPLRLGFDVFSNGGSISDRKRKDLVRLMKSQEEARMVYNNHIEAMKSRKGNYMYVDVGGGSTEINLLADGELICSRSYNIGTVRMLNGAVSEGEWKRFRSDMEDLAASYPGINIIGSGGNINKLYKLVERRDKRYPRMHVSSLQALYGRLREMSVRERMEEYGLKPDRADVIVPAGEIFLTIAAITGASYIYVPVIGLSDRRSLHQASVRTGQISLRCIWS